MLRGDLATLPLEALLRDLTGTAATGCLHLLHAGHLRDDAADETGAELVGHGDEAARIYLCDGGVCAAFLPDWTRRLGNRLVSLGLLAPDVLTAVLQAQQGELIDWQLAELLVNLGYIADDVAEDAVGAAALEELYEAVSQLSRCTNGRWRFRRNERCRAASSRGGVPRQSVDSLLAEVARRDRVWAGLLPVVGGLDAIPALAVGTTPDSLSLDRLTWALLCKVDASVARTLPMPRSVLQPARGVRGKARGSCPRLPVIHAASQRCHVCENPKGCRSPATDTLRAS